MTLEGRALFSMQHYLLYPRAGDKVTICEYQVNYNTNYNIGKCQKEAYQRKRQPTIRKFPKIEK